MFRKLPLLSFIAVLAGSTPALADEWGTALEWDVETNTVATSLPEMVPSPMIARSCLTCTGVDLNVSKDTKFFEGKTPVTLTELRAAAKTNRFMMVFYHPKTRVVTRIVIRGVTPAK